MYLQSIYTSFQLKLHPFKAEIQSLYTCWLFWRCVINYYFTFTPSLIYKLH